MPAASPDLPGACRLPATPSQGEVGGPASQHLVPLPSLCQGLWGLTGPVTKLSYFTALWGTCTPYSAEILKLAETPDRGPGSYPLPKGCWCALGLW